MKKFAVTIEDINHFVYEVKAKTESEADEKVNEEIDNCEIISQENIKFEVIKVEEIK
jgi:hypothetical protein